MSKQNYTFSTAEERASEHRRRVGDDVDTNIEFMQEDSLLDAIKTFERQIWNAPFSGIDIDRDRKITVPGNGKGWEFAERDMQFAFKNAVTLEAALLEGSTGNAEVSDTSIFKNESGAAIIYDQYGTWDYVTYQSVADPNLVTMGDVNIDHASGESVEKLYKLAPDFARAKKLVVADNPMYEGDENPKHGFFCTYNGFLWMPRRFGISSGTLTYWKQRTELESMESTLNIPDILDPVLDNLLDARAFRLGGESEQMISDALFMAADALRAAMGYTTSTSNKRIRLARPMPRSPTSSMQRGRVISSNFDEGNYT